MRLGSLFDGSGAAPLAATMCGIEPVWASEIEPYPIRVTKARFPKMLHLGDITKINGAEVQHVDIICGGSPCQDLSVAGKQKGLQNGSRSHLFYEMTRIIQQMREETHGRYPRYVIWENVPGAFSSNRGADFLAVLRAFAEIAEPNVYVPEPARENTDRLDWKCAGSIVGNGWSVAWRTVDAQYWGVPQRRRRIYLVTDFASERAGEILFECEGGSGNPEPCVKARQGASDHAAGGAGGSNRVKCLNPDDPQTIRQYDASGIFATLSSNSGGGQDRRGICYECAAFMGGQGSKAGGLGYAEEIAPTIKSVLSGGNTVPDVVYSINDHATRNRGGGQARNGDGAGNGLGVRDNGVMYTLDTASRHAVCVGNGQLHNISMAEQMNTLDCMHDQQAVLMDGNPPRRYIVRRLTPLECCRLQGFPDWWEQGVNGSDSARYKMWGNGMALPNILHVMRGIVMEAAKEEV